MSGSTRVCRRGVPRVVGRVPYSASLDPVYGGSGPVLREASAHTMEAGINNYTLFVIPASDAQNPENC